MLGITQPPPPFDLASFNEARCERNIYLSAAIVLLCEHFNLMEVEIDFFWKQRWSTTKAVFLWSRYFSLANMLSNAALFIWSDPDWKFCYGLFVWQGTGTTIQLLTSHIMLEIRLYAMYGASLKILTLFIVLTIGEVLAMVMVFAIPSFDLTALISNEPFRGNFICSETDTPGARRTLLLWGSLITVESILLGMTIVKTWKHRKGSSLMQKLTRDSILYSSLIVAMYLFNLVFWMRSGTTLKQLVAPFTLVFASILCNRLIISLRSGYYDADLELNNSVSLRPIEFARHQVTSDAQIFQRSSSNYLTPHVRQQRFQQY